MRVLLTGGTGFIGSHTVDALLARQADVSVLSPRMERYRDALPGVRYFQGSFGDEAIVNAALADSPDTVIHLANHGLSIGNAGFPESEQRNLCDSVRLFELCVEHGVRKIVFVSSGGKVYGNTNGLPMREDSPTDPLGAYGITKLMIEKYLLSLAWYHDFTPVIVRPSNPYGERQSPDGAQGVIAVFAGRMLQEQPITVWGDGSTVRDYVRVSDLADLCARVALQPSSGVYNAGTGMGVQTMELVEMLANVLKIRPILKREPARKHDLPAIVLDCSRARQELQWHPQTDLRAGMAEYAVWLRQITSMGSPRA